MLGKDYVILSQKEALLLDIMQAESENKEAYYMAVMDLNESNFEQVIKSQKGVVLVDFWAPWCMPCRMLAPVIEQVAEEVSDITVAKVNVDDQQVLAMQYQVMNIPTLLVFKDGVLANRSVGVIPKEDIVDLVK